MLNLFNRDVVIVDNGKLVEISGIPAMLIDRDIAKVWGTRKIQTYMFITVSRRKIVIPTFFVVEFIYMLQEMISTHTRLYSDKEVLKRTVESLMENTWLSTANKDHPSIFKYQHIKEMNITLLDHQRRFLAWYDHVKPRYNLKGILLTAAPGGGKTITAIATALAREAEIVFIISPKNAVHRVWQTELDVRFHKPQNVWVSADGKPVPKNTKWFIFHYEDLDKALELQKQFINQCMVVIVDESHNFNDVESHRTKAFLQLCSPVWITDIIFASGTPIKAMGSDSIPLLRAIDPYLFTPEVEVRFRKIFGKDAKKANDILANRLGIISYKVPKSDFMPDEPEYVPLPITIPNGDYFTLENIKNRMRDFIQDRVSFYQKRRESDLEFYYYCMSVYEKDLVKESGEWREYQIYKANINTFVTKGFDSTTMSEQSIFCNRFEKEYIMPKLPAEHRKDFKDVKSAVKYPELKIRGEALGRVLGRERIAANVAIAKSVDYDTIIAGSLKKVICFSSHVAVVDEVHDFLKAKKYKPVKVTAETNNDLKNIVSKFEKTKDINPLVATYQSLSTAVPMTMANTLIMLNFPFRIHEMDQAVARAWRIGQDKRVTVYLVQLDTGPLTNISSRSADIMNWSKEQVDQIMGYNSATDIDIGLEDISDNMINVFEDRWERNTNTCISQENQLSIVTQYQNEINVESYSSKRKH